MVIDTSALVAILCDEPERRGFNQAIDEAETRLVSAASLVETSIVLEARYGPDAAHDLDLFVAKAAIEIAPVDLEQAQVARRAFREYGKGRHPAGLNLGDCFVYALAKLQREDVLCKGDDFRRTDLETVT